MKLLNRAIGHTDGRIPRHFELALSGVGRGPILTIEPLFGQQTGFEKLAQGFTVHCEVAKGPGMAELNESAGFQPTRRTGGKRYGRMYFGGPLRQR